MKNNQLEKFITENRSILDAHEPSEAVWKRIERKLFGTSLWNEVNVWRAAALFLLGLSVLLYFNKETSISPIANTSGSQEFSDVEKYYTAQISEKSALISMEGLFADDNVTQDLQKLEAMYSVLADEMKRQPSEKVKDAMVLNMLVRIDLLNQQIQKLEESKRKKEIISSI